VSEEQPPREEDRPEESGDGTNPLDSRTDIDKAFAAIVANWSDEADPALATWPDQENLSIPRHRRDEAGGEGDIEGGPFRRRRTDAADGTETTSASTADPALDDEPLFELPARSAGPRDVPVPAEPPPLPRGDLFGILAWAGALGGPLFLLIAVIAWRDAPRELVFAAVAAFVAGFVTLVVRLPARRDDDDGDDGAVV
jgi:hypothetical protein